MFLSCDRFIVGSFICGARDNVIEGDRVVEVIQPDALMCFSGLDARR